MRYFITGTDTGSGKTYATCLLLEALRRRGRRAVGFKPLCCGDRGDVFALAEASGNATGAEEINPEWFKTPASPYTASLIENRPADLGAIMRAYAALDAAFEDLLVEGAGGWAVPLCQGKTMGDLAKDFDIPVIVVVNNRLGALNHTLLTVRQIIADGLECAGVILNYVEDERDVASISNRAVLEEFLPCPVLCEIMHGETEIEWPLGEG